ncbi:hypothetical protein SDC9_83730 [bioreactor metagenome]|uniref:Uncharacterized protein n=1 Tax=bioreactor metagenome TaxID=1076179 RepID=A0A644ZH18_9ZZZZ
MQLVDEEDDAPLGLFDLAQHGLEPLFKLTPVFGTGHQGAHVQREHGFVLKGHRHVALYNALGQPLGDGGFAHARLADEHRVILGFPGQDTDDVADFVVPADYRVKLVASGPVHQVSAVFFQRVVGLLRVVGGDPLAAPHRGKGLEHPFLGNVIGSEQLLEAAAGAFHQRQKQMLYRDVFVLHARGGFFRLIQDLIHVGGNVDFACLPARAAYPGQG